MSKVHLLSKYYSTSKTKFRYVSSKTRGINERIIASKRGKDYFDGLRKYGYGGYRYDGRWAQFAQIIIKRYKLNNNSRILHLNSEKGFLLYEIKKKLPKIKIFAYETSKYAIKKTISRDIRNRTKYTENYLKLGNFKKKFDLSIAIGVIYAMSLKDSISMLKYLKKNSKNSFITLASYDSESDFILWKNWSLLGCLLFKENEWRTILKKSNYDYDYEIINSKTLNLKQKK